MAAARGAVAYMGVMASPISLPDSPSVVAGAARAAVLTEDGEMLSLSAEAAGRRLRTGPAPLLVHAPATLKRLGLGPMACLDLLELFAFVLPARGVAPTPRGLALALEVAPPKPGLEDAAALLPDLAEALLGHLARLRGSPQARRLAGLAARMGGKHVNMPATPERVWAALNG